MADEITVRTNYTFLSEDGTSYDRDVSFFSDDNTTASLPKRYVFYASDGGEYTALDFSGLPAYHQQVMGASMCWLVNRDEGRDMYVRLQTSSMDESRIIKPGEWVYVDVCEGDQGVLGGGGSFTYGAEPFLAITVLSDFQSARGELITIYKATS